MSRTFKIGDRVIWNSEAGRVRGTIVKVHTKDVNYKGYVHHASRDEPQYEIKSDKTDHVAMHKGAALRRLDWPRESAKYGPGMTYPFFTIGHSTRPIGEFVGLLGYAEVQFVVDVRTVPRSRTNPQYNGDVLPLSLFEFQIGYGHIAALGGLRGRRREVPEPVNAFWQNQSFHNYADYALSENFRLGLNTLRDLGHHSRCAIMCAEAVWWRCHRRIITDYLIANGEAVFHILGHGRIEPAHITDAARPASGGTLTYPADLMGSR